MKNKKTIAEMITVMQAYKDGKQIQVKENSGDVWIECPDPLWNWFRFQYRIKPEVKYRPYKDADEMIVDYCNRFKTPFLAEHEMPLIWIKDNHGNKGLITTVGTYRVSTTIGDETMDGLFNYRTYLDGSPCGKLVE